MQARTTSFVLQGIDPVLCEVEIEIGATGQLPPKPLIVGLPDAAVKESLERVRAALTHCHYGFIEDRLLVNLAPADMRKEGPVYDLPIAIGLLMAKGSLNEHAKTQLPTTLMAGELALDGRLRPIRGVINLALLAAKKGYKQVIVPEENAAEATAVSNIQVIGATTLTQVVAHLCATDLISPLRDQQIESALEHSKASVDFAEVRGQEAAKRAMLVAACGGHNIMMLGPAGTGKTMLAKALPGILPPLSREEAVEVTRIWSSVGKVPKGTPLLTQRPYRSPHHTASSASLIGGGPNPRPGEVSLAHHGVLFLDEMPEFPRQVLETLRQPLEDGYVTITRAMASLRFPARMMLVAALNPTPSGEMPGDTFSRKTMQRYLSRLSGPMIDRIDIHVEVPRIPFDQLADRPTGTPSTELRQQVIEARQRSITRNGSPLKPNAALSHRELDSFAPMEPQAKEVLRSAMNQMGLSARAYDKIRRVARTLADLDRRDILQPRDLCEAIQYRLMDRLLGDAQPNSTRSHLSN